MAYQSLAEAGRGDDALGRHVEQREAAVADLAAPQLREDVGALLLALAAREEVRPHALREHGLHLVGLGLGLGFGLGLGVGVGVGVGLGLGLHLVLDERDERADHLVRGRGRVRGRVRGRGRGRGRGKVRGRSRVS